MTAETSVERRTGAAMALGAVVGHIAGLRTDAYGVEHSVALSLAYADLTSTTARWITAITEGGDLPWSLDA